MKKLNKIKNYSLKNAKIGKKKNVKGFTLVELIVVIAIIGVLAVALLPQLFGKVQSSRLATANDGAAKIAEQAGIIIAELEVNGAVITGGTISATISDDDAESFKTEMNKALNLDGYNWAVVIDDDGKVTGAAYGETGGKYIGTYPDKQEEPLDGEDKVDEKMCITMAGGTVAGS